MEGMFCQLRDRPLMNRVKIFNEIAMFVMSELDLKPTQIRELP